MLNTHVSVKCKGQVGLILDEFLNFVPSRPLSIENGHEQGHYRDEDKKTKLINNSHHFSMNSSLMILQVIRSFGNIVTILTRILFYFVYNFLEPDLFELVCRLT